MDHTDALLDIEEEFIRATNNHKPFHSPHEGYAVIKEELDELWEEVRKLKSFDDRNSDLKKEAVQLGAMVLRFLVDLIGEEQ
jgi:hypothetical protein